VKGGFYGSFALCAFFSCAVMEELFMSRLNSKQIHSFGD